MKRILQIFLASVLVFSTLLCPTFAKDYEFQSDTEIVTFDDGSYIEIVTKSYPSITRASEKYAEKVFTYKTYWGTDILSYTLKGWFEYTSGVSSKATAVDYSYEIYETGWSFDSHDESLSGDTVYGSAVLPNVFRTKNIEGPMSCDKYGRIS